MLLTLGIIGAGIGIVSGIFSTYVTWLNWRKVKSVQTQVNSLKKHLKIHD